MNKNTPVLSFTYNERFHSPSEIIDIFNKEFAPLGIIDYKFGLTDTALSDWWRHRAIPASRDNIRELLEKMNISAPVELLEKNYGLSLSDQYWIKEKGSLIEWKDINFFDNEFSEDMGRLLMGEIEYSDTLNIISPDNSSDGMLRKKWKIINGKRCLLKSSSAIGQEPFNEVIATKLYERLLDKNEYVPYTIVEDNGIYYSSCETMVNSSEELVSAWDIDSLIKLRGSDSPYNHFINACDTLDIPNVRKSIDKMLVCDFIIANYDRHYRNFGAIRNVETLEWKGIAPIYDSGSSMWARETTEEIGKPYSAKPFRKDTIKQLELVKDFSWYDETKLIGFEDDIREVFSISPNISEQRIKAITKAVLTNIDRVNYQKHSLELLNVQEKDNIFDEEEQDQHQGPKM